MNTNRRQFGKQLAALSVATLAGTASAERKRPMIKPARLRKGDLVGLIAPSGYLTDEQIERCVSNLEAIGMRVKLSHNVRAARGGYGGTIKQRLLDLHGMFQDREVRAIWAGRGGSGCNMLLPWLDYDLIRANAKILVGYSDITALHLAIHRQSQLVTFHGPVGTSRHTAYTLENMLPLLMEPQSTRVITMSEENNARARDQPQFALRTLKAGIAEGRLIGGNLSVLCALIGTPYAAQTDKALVFLEDVSEAPYRVDRMLTQVQQSVARVGEARLLHRSAGVMLGVFQRGNPSANEASLTMSEVIDDHFADSPVPAVYGYSFGHIQDQFTIPVGVRARLDTAAQTVTLLENAVV